MQYNLDITIQSLYNTGRISTRTYNCLHRAGLMTLKAVLNYGKTPKALLTLKNLGKNSYAEILSLLSEVCQEPSPIAPTTKEEAFSLIDEHIGIMLREAYALLFVENNSVTNYFKETYQTVEMLHDAVIGDVESLMEVRDQLSMRENVEFRSMFVNYLYVSINKMLNGQCSDNYIYIEYKTKYSELSSRLKEFTYKQKFEHFMSLVAKKNLFTIYEEMHARTSVRTRHFLDRFAPKLEYLVPFFDAPLKSYGKLCPGQDMKRTLVEVFNFNQQLKAEFDQIWQMKDDEVLLAMLKHNYPFLTGAECRFVTEHEKTYGVYPQIYLLYSYMRQSEVKNNKVFSLLYGIFDGKERTSNEVAEMMGLSRERIRQIVSGYIEVHNTRFIKNNEWKFYEELFSLPYITAETIEYKHLKEREHLSFDFHVFGRLMQLLGNHESEKETKRFSCQYETEIVNGVAVVINRKYMPSIKIRDCVESLQQLVSSRCICDRWIDIASILTAVNNSEKEDAMKLMVYVAKKGLQLETNDRNQVLIRQNHIDVGDELYNILARKGEPMSVNELFEVFKGMHPNHKYIESAQIRHCLFKHPHIKAIGNSSRYGLDVWENVFYGTIRDLLIKLLKDSNEPIHVEELFNTVIEYYPDTTIGSLAMSMKVDELDRFLAFKGGFFGLKEKQYDESFQEINRLRRFTFEERLADFCNFVDTYNHYPVSINGDDEASLYRWLYNVRNEVYKIKDEYKERLAKVLARYEAEFVPRNATENEFRNNCRKYKAYINSHNSLPTVSTEPELYGWMVRSKANYSKYVDYRKKYLKDLFNYIISQGIDIREF